MLFALRQPGLLLGLVVGFLVGSLAQSLLAAALGGGTVSVRRVASGWGWLDPFGVVAALIGGVGWGPRPASRRGRPESDWRPLVASLGAHAAVAAAALAGFWELTGSLAQLTFVSTTGILHGSQTVVGLPEQITLGAAVINVGCGLLSLFPLPPLELGVLLWSRLPTTPRARAIAYRVTEDNWGVAIVLVLLLLPLAGEEPLLLALVGAVTDPILHAL